MFGDNYTASNLSGVVRVLNLGEVLQSERVLLQQCRASPHSHLHSAIPLSTDKLHTSS